MDMPRLILFDIDETMITSGGSGRKALERAMREVFYRTISFEGYSLSGKTDPQICLEVLSAHGYAAEEVKAVLPRLFEVYLPILEEEVQRTREAHIHAGVEELLGALQARSDAYMGLLTGNIEAGARLKLHRFGLNGFFEFGAFGCDSADRMALPAVAHERANKHFGKDFTVEDMVIIGDARNDVLCAKGYGTTSIAVCTGKTLKEELAELQPDFLFDSLSNTHDVLQAIFVS